MLVSDNDNSNDNDCCWYFLPHDVTQSAVMPQYVVRLSDHLCDVQVPYFVPLLIVWH